MKVRRALDLQFQIAGEHFALHSPREGVSYRARVLTNSQLVELLIGLAKWECAEVVALKLAQISSTPLEVATAELDHLINAGLLVSDTDDEQVKVFAGRDTWETFGWGEAFSYHALSDAVKRVDYTQPDGQRADVAAMRDYVSQQAPPPVYMPPVSDRRIPLPAPRETLPRDSSAVLALNEELSGASTPLSAGDLSTILWFGFGQTGIKKLPVTGEHLLKASPSGGSRHPTEAYVLILEPSEIPAGIYHYGVEDHDLGFISNAVDHSWVARHVVGKPEWMAISPTVAIVLTSRVEVSMYRYRENFSYRPIHHDVGHALETAALAAKSLDCKVFRGYSVDESEVGETLGNERLMNPTMAFMLLAG